MQFLIIGCGSMGKRRAHCLRQLGFAQIAACDPREDRLREIAERSQVSCFSHLEQALAARADLALVCTPPHLHRPCLERCIHAGIPVFCEAPMAMTLDDMDTISDMAEQAGVFLAPSCTYLHNPIHQTIEAYLREGTLGRPLAAVSHVGQHVADWHPYEDYRAFYASKRAEGGMCFDMLPHELQLFTRLFGDVRALSCMARRRSRDIESDGDANDVYDVILDMEPGVSLLLHQDVFQRPWGEYRKVMCERGVIEWTWQSLRVARYAGPGFLSGPQWEDVPLEGYGFENMYARELEHAIEALKGHAEYLMPLSRERRVLEWTLACEDSSRTGRHLVFT